MCVFVCVGFMFDFLLLEVKNVDVYVNDLFVWRARVYVAFLDCFFFRGV